MVGTSATVDFRDRRLSTAARSAGTVRAILGEGDIFALRSSELAGCTFGPAERRDQISSRPVAAREASIVVLSPTNFREAASAAPTIRRVAGAVCQRFIIKVTRSLICACALAFRLTAGVRDLMMIAGSNHVATS
jgi:hypothetical protein